MHRVVVNDLAGVSALNKTGFLPSVCVGHDITRSSLGSRHGEFTGEFTYVEDSCEQCEEDRVRRHTADSLTWLLRIRRCVLSTDVKCFRKRFDYV